MLYHLQFSCWTIAQAQDLFTALAEAQFDPGDIEDWVDDQAHLTVPQVYILLNLHSLEDVATAKAIATLRSPMRIFFGVNEGQSRSILFNLSRFNGSTPYTFIEEGWLYDPTLSLGDEADYADSLTQQWAEGQDAGLSSEEHPFLDI